MMHRILTCISLIVALSGFAQDPFQQDLDYVISVSLDDESHDLTGHIKITYGNNSPGSLDTLWLHLWPNAYKDRFSSLCAQHTSMNQFDLHYTADQDKGSIDLSDLTIDGNPGKWGYHPELTDVGWVLLDRPLEPNSTLILESDFSVSLNRSS